MQRMMDKVQNNYQHFEKRMKIELEGVTEKLMGEKFERYEKVYKDFSLYFNSSDLTKELNSKAETSYVQMLSG